MTQTFREKETVDAGPSQWHRPIWDPQVDYPAPVRTHRQILWPLICIIQTGCGTAGFLVRRQRKYMNIWKLKYTEVIKKKWKRQVADLELSVVLLFLDFPSRQIEPCASSEGRRNSLLAPQPHLNQETKEFQTLDRVKIAAVGVIREELVPFHDNTNA